MTPRQPNADYAGACLRLAFPNQAHLQGLCGIDVNITLREGHDDAIGEQGFMQHVAQVAGNDPPIHAGFDLDPDIQAKL